MYIAHFTIHGLVRGTNLEMGRDADTGGQVKYVIELAKELIKSEGVDKVDVFTRKIVDPQVDDIYGQEIEELCEGVRLVRIKCGPNKYIRKEALWPHLPEFIDGVVRFFKKNGLPDYLHSHYADAGFVGVSLKDLFDIPLIHTGHSLGRSKKDRLLNGGMTEEQANKKYKLKRRIAAEEEVLLKADLTVTSTHQEMVEQYGKYTNAENARFAIIPPGIDAETFYPYYREGTDESKAIRARVREELSRFWRDPRKPYLLTICRPDPKKNILSLIEAYATNPELRNAANLAVYAGVRDDIREKTEGERKVLTDIVMAMDKWDLYGQLAIPKRHDFQTEVPEIYRLAAEAGGVFVNPALVEPFGLTLVEASATGLPIVATNQGGPVEIMERCQNGYLINVTSTKEIADVCKNLLRDGQVWTRFSDNGINGVADNYTWKSHVQEYVKIIPEIAEGFPGIDSREQFSIGRRLQKVSKLLISDIDHTLVGADEELQMLLGRLDDNREHVGFGIATGRDKHLCMEVFNQSGIPIPDVMICSVGTEIYYSKKFVEDIGWKQYLMYRWNRRRVVDSLSEMEFLSLQDAYGQSELKVSYHVAEDYKEKIPEGMTLESYVRAQLKSYRCAARVVFSSNCFLDIIPLRAGKGRAIRYLQNKWNIPRESIIVAGYSGNDREMLSLANKAIIVSNYSSELESLKGKANVFFSNEPSAKGILEGLDNYKFWPRAS